MYEQTKAISLNSFVVPSRCQLFTIYIYLIPALNILYNYVYVIIVIGGGEILKLANNFKLLT